MMPKSTKHNSGHKRGGITGPVSMNDDSMELTQQTLTFRKNKHSQQRENFGAEQSYLDTTNEADNSMNRPNHAENLNSQGREDDEAHLYQERHHKYRQGSRERHQAEAINQYYYENEDDDEPCQQEAPYGDDNEDRNSQKETI